MSLPHSYDCPYMDDYPYLIPEKQIKYLTRLTKEQKSDWDSEYKSAYGLWPNHRANVSLEDFLDNVDQTKPKRCEGERKKKVRSRPQSLFGWATFKYKDDFVRNPIKPYTSEFEEESPIPEAELCPTGSHDPFDPTNLDYAVHWRENNPDHLLDNKSKPTWQKIVDSDDEDEDEDDVSEREESFIYVLDGCEQMSETRVDQDKINSEENTYEPAPRCRRRRRRRCDSQRGNSLRADLDKLWETKQEFTVSPEDNFLDPSTHKSTKVQKKMSLKRVEVPDAVEKSSPRENINRSNAVELQQALEKVQKTLLESVYHKSYCMDGHLARPKSRGRPDMKRYKGSQSVYKRDFQWEDARHQRPFHPVQMKNIFTNGDWKCYNTTYSDLYSKEFDLPKLLSQPNHVRKGTSNQNPKPQKSNSKIVRSKTGWGGHIQPPN